MNQPPGQPPFGPGPPPPYGAPPQAQGYPQQQQQQGYPPQQGYPAQQGYPPPQQGYPAQQGYPPPQQGYPAQQGYPPQQGYLQQPPQPQPQPQPGWAPAPPNGSWAADSAKDKQRNAALSAAFAPKGGWEGISRARGAGILALGLFLLAINVVSLTTTERYYIQAMFATPVAILLGIYMLAVGTPRDAQSGDIAVWAKLGYGVTAVVGVLLGILALVLVGC